MWDSFINLPNSSILFAFNAATARMVRWFSYTACFARSCLTGSLIVSLCASNSASVRSPRVTIGISDFSSSRAVSHSLLRSLYAESTRLCFTLLFVITIFASGSTTGAYSYSRVFVSRKIALSFLPMALAN